MDTQIYALTSKVTGKQYVGSTISGLPKRLTNHQSDARCGGNLKIHQAMRDEGPENFTISLLEICPRKQSQEREQYWITKLDTVNNGYNSIGAQKGPRQHKNPDHKSIGVKRPKYTKERIEKFRNSKARDWEITLPDKTVIVIRNLSQFCKDHKISASSLQMRGKTKGYLCKRIY